MSRNGDALSVELDAMAASLLAHLAEIWGVSEEEAVRRALEQANAGIELPGKESRLHAFKELQRRLGLTSAKAAEWQNTIREIRR